MKFTRTLSIEHRAPNAEGLFDIAISTEAPYERWFGIEILRHDATAVDLTLPG